MRLVSCLNPRYITNPHTHEKMVVPCGKCVACRNKHASFWVRRLRNEQRSWKYCFLVTLTYDDLHLPTLHFDEVLDLAVDYNTGFCIPISDLITNDAKSNNYLFSRLRTRLGLPYCSTDIIQKFHKRLNKYIHDNYTQKYQNFRYFLATEYGGTTFRTHHHALYFFNNDRVAASFKEILAKTWQNTDNVEVGIDAQQVTGNAASYVAQYINCYHHYPEVYKNPKLRPKYYFSKSPSLGSLLPLDESTNELFYRCSPTRVEYNYARNIYDVVRIPLQVENRLYPRIPRFRETDSFVRVRLFELCGRETTFKGFLQRLAYFKESFDRHSEYTSVIPETDRMVYNYFSWLSNGFKMEKKYYLSDDAYKTTLNRLLRFFYIARRVNVQSYQFGVSLWQYDKMITRYYDNLDLYHIRNFYEIQENYANLHGFDDLPLLYNEPSDCVERYSLEVVPYLESSYAYSDLKSRAELIEKKNTKTHVKNEYLDNMRDRNLSLIIKSYLYG